MEHMVGGAYQGTDSNNTLWVTPYGATASQAGSNSTPSAGYSQKTGGIAFGTDRPVDELLRVGAAVLLEKTGYTGANQITQDSLATTSYQIAGYAQQRIGESTALRLIANLAYDQNGSQRINSINGVNQQATASYGGWHGLVSAEGSQTWMIGNNAITPLTRLYYGYAGVNSYSETGATTQNLNVGAQNSNALVAGIGGRYQYNFTETHHFLARAVVGYDFLAKSTALSATDINGLSFNTYSINPGSLVTDLGFGYEIQSKNDIRMRLNYDYYGRTGYSNRMINFNLIVPF
jgi:uncharacterized protein with beta-barrel porin domain